MIQGSRCRNHDSFTTTWARHRESCKVGNQRSSFKVGEKAWLVLDDLMLSIDTYLTILHKSAATIHYESSCPYLRFGQN